MVGSDVATICISRIAMNMPTHIVTKPSQAPSVTGGGELGSDLIDIA